MSTDRDHPSSFAIELRCSVAELRASADSTPKWPPADEMRRELRELADRLAAVERRADAPLVIAMLGGSGTGKSTLINAMLGETAVATGRQRPTTTTPILICRRDLSPELLGIEPAGVRTVHRDAPLLDAFALIDCPDPDTSEEPPDTDLTIPESQPTNTERLRAILPHCDVLLLTGTQQKYRSNRVFEELATFASGAKVYCVQTHADRDTDVRDDWRSRLRGVVTRDEMFFVDARLADEDVKETSPESRSEFARLLETLSRETGRKSAARLRRWNVHRLVEERFDAIEQLLKTARPALKTLREAVSDRRRTLLQQRIERLKADLPNGRAHWEQRLMADIANYWGFSPFKAALRGYLGLGSLLSGAMLLRMRSTMQVAIWGAVEGARALAKSGKRRRAEKAIDRMADAFCNETDLRENAFILRGYAVQAGLDSGLVDDQSVLDEAKRGATDWSDTIRQAMEERLGALTRRASRWLFRGPYEILLTAMLAFVLVRPAKNFFYDSFIGDAPLLGTDYYLGALFWFVLWSALLLWSFSARVRRRLGREMRQVAAEMAQSAGTDDIFIGLTDQIDAIEAFEQRLEAVRTKLADIATLPSADDS